MTPLGRFTLVKPVQESNAEAPMLVTLVEIVATARLLQPKNVKAPILVTLSGIAALVKLPQNANAPWPMLVTLAGMVTLVRLVRSEEHTSELQSLRHLVCRLLLE